MPKKTHRTGGKWVRHRLRLSTPQQVGKVLEQDRQANGDQRRGHYRSVSQALENRLLQDHCQHQYQRHGERQRKKVIDLRQADQVERKKTANHVKLAMREIRDVHHAENHCESDRDQRVGTANQQSIK